MTPRLKLESPASIDSNDVAYFTRFAQHILAATSAGFLVAIVLAAELRLSPEERLELLHTTTYSAP